MTCCGAVHQVTRAPFPVGGGHSRNISPPLKAERTAPLDNSSKYNIYYVLGMCYRIITSYYQYVLYSSIQANYTLSEEMYACYVDYIS